MSQDVFHHEIPTVSRAMEIVYAVVIRKGYVPNCRDTVYRIDKCLTEREVRQLVKNHGRRRALIREALTLLQRRQVLAFKESAIVAGPQSPSEVPYLEMATNPEQKPKKDRVEHRHGRQALVPHFTG